jgi:Dna[CI] antecedent, DciA
VKPDLIGDDVRRELARFGPAEGMTEIVQAWPAAVGEQIARNAWPARLARDRTLHVATSSSAWAFELAQLEPTIREHLAELAPTRIRFVPGPLPEADVVPPAQATQTLPPPSLEEVRQGHLLASEIDDEDLRELAARAAAASLAKARSDRVF